MTDTLFDLPDSPSPRLEWMRRHKVTIMPRFSCDDYKAFSGDKNIIESGYGDTELEALTDFAINNNLKLWNEE